MKYEYYYDVRYGVHTWVYKLKIGEQIAKYVTSGNKNPRNCFSIILVNMLE